MRRFFERNWRRRITFTAFFETLLASPHSNIWKFQDSLPLPLPLLHLRPMTSFRCGIVAINLKKGFTFWYTSTDWNFRSVWINGCALLLTAEMAWSAKSQRFHRCVRSLLIWSLFSTALLNHLMASFLEAEVDSCRPLKRSRCSNWFYTSLLCPSWYITFKGGEDQTDDLAALMNFYFAQFRVSSHIFAVPASEVFFAERYEEVDKVERMVNHWAQRFKTFFRNIMSFTKLLSVSFLGSV